MIRQVTVLRGLRIGVHLIGDDGFNVPPAHALARRGIVGNVRGYPIYGDYREPNPPARLIEALAQGEIDVAIALGQGQSPGDIGNSRGTALDTVRKQIKSVMAKTETRRQADLASLVNRLRY